MSGRMGRRAVWLFVALVALTACLAPLTALAQQVVGTVVKLSGSAQIQRAGATIAVVQGMAIDLHDQLTTSVNSSATVRLASGIALTLAAHTNLTFNQNTTTGGTSRTQLNLLEGGLRLLVPPLLRTESFEIHTPNAITAVRGTDFDTTYFEGTVRPGYEGCQRYTDVRVREGVVAVSNLANPTQVVESMPATKTVPCDLAPLNAGPLGIAGAAGPGEAGGRSEGGGGGGIPPPQAVRPPPRSASRLRHLGAAVRLRRLPRCRLPVSAR